MHNFTIFVFLISLCTNISLPSSGASGSLAFAIQTVEAANSSFSFAMSLALATLKCEAVGCRGSPYLVAPEPPINFDLSPLGTIFVV